MGEIAKAFVTIGTKWDPKGIDQAVRGLRKYGINITNVSKDLKTLGILGGVAATALVAGSVMAIKKAAEFETQMANVNTMLDKQATMFLPKLAKEVLRMSKKYGEGTATLTKGLYDILSASVPVEKAMGVLDVSVRAAKAGMTDAGVAADAITTILNSFSLATEEAASVSDLLFTIVKRGKTTFAELAPNIGKVASLAATSGLSLEEMGSALATMTRAGVRTDIAITSLRSLMSGFVSPTTEAKKAAAEMGIELNTATLKSDGLLSVVKKLSGATPEQTAAIFGNIRALTGLSAILENSAGFMKDLDLMTNRAGNTQEAFEKQTKTTQFQVAKLMQTLNVIAINIGADLLPVVNELTAIISDALAPAFDELTDNTKKVNVAGKILVTTFGYLLGSIIAIIEGFNLAGDAIAIFLIQFTKHAKSAKQASEDWKDDVQKLGERIAKLTKRDRDETKNAEKSKLKDRKKTIAEILAEEKKRRKKTLTEEKRRIEKQKKFEDSLFRYQLTIGTKTLEDKRVRIEEMLSNVKEGTLRETELKKELYEVEKEMARDAQYTIVGGWREAINEMQEIHINWADNFIDVMNTVKSSTADIFESVLQGTYNMQTAMESLWESIKNIIIRKAAEALANEAVGALIGLLTGGKKGKKGGKLGVVGGAAAGFALAGPIGGIVGGIAGLFGLHGGGSVKKPMITSFAEPGTGGEIALPLKSPETISALAGALAQAGSGNTYYITVPYLSNRSHAKQMARYLGDEIIKPVKRARKI